MKVLVIDDDPAVRFIIARILVSGGHEPIEAESGLDGIEAFLRGRYALVITDLQMPGMDGIETIRRIRELDRGVPIIAVSGGEAEVAEAGTGGANVRLTKPFAIDELLDAIKALLSEKG